MQATILVVDDSYCCREAVAAMLEKMGHRVVCTGSCRRAIDIVEETCPDLMLLDVALPDGSGIDLLREVRERCQQDFPVIVFTGSADVRYLVGGLGVCECLVKSLASNSHIRAAVEDALRRPPSANRYAVA